MANRTNQDKQNGTLLSDIVEELFEDGGSADPETSGTDRTGTYIAKVKLSVDIPELVL